MLKIVHFEILAKNPEVLITFYKNVFGWEITKWEGDMVTMDYWMINSGPKDVPGINGGLVKRVEKMESGSPSAFVCTIDVPNIDKYIKLVTDNGGTIYQDKVNIPGVGWLAYCKDTEGNSFGIIESTMIM